jgi:RHS repeat-associated protein
MTGQASYDSFGNPITALNTRYGYTGRERDEFTGLQYNRARWYDPNLGRFISEDPIGFRGGDVNLYGYVRNRPLKFRDSRGLSGEEILNNPDVLKGAAAIVTAVAPYVPPVAVAAVGAAAIYEAYRAGQSVANSPSNPFVNGPWNPFGTPYPNQAEAIRKLTSPTAKPAPFCQPAPRAIPWNNWPPITYPIPLGPYPPQTPEKQEECYQKCQHLLGIGDYGVQYLACYRRCTGAIE